MCDSNLHYKDCSKMHSSSCSQMSSSCRCPIERALNFSLRNGSQNSGYLRIGLVETSSFYSIFTDSKQNTVPHTVGYKLKGEVCI